MRGVKQYLIGWKDHSYRDDTWEDEEDIKPVSKLAKFNNLVCTIQVLDRRLWLLVCDRLADRLTSTKLNESEPVCLGELDIEELSFEEIVRPLLK